MAKKVLKTDAAGQVQEPAKTAASGTVEPGVGTVETVGSETRSLGPEAGKRGDLLFRLYVARISTIDRYRVPITDKGLPAAYRKAYEEAVVALDVFDECRNERKN